MNIGFSEQIWWLYLIVFLYSISSSAFGLSGIALLTTFTFFFGAKASIGLITLFFLYQNISKLLFFHQHIYWNIGLKVIVYAIPGAIAGSYLLQFIPTIWFEKCLASFILISITNDVFHFMKNKKAQKKSLPLYSLGYGFSSGFLGSGNMLRGTLFLGLGLIKESFIATSALTAFFINIPKIIMYSQGNILSMQMFFISIPMIFLSMSGTFLGKKLLKKVKDHFFFYIVNGVLFFSAIALLFH